MNDKTFAAALTRIREKAGLTKYGLAKAAGVDAAFIGLIEAGQKMPGWETACKLADALGVSLDQFRR
jgi:transcriptional regulator with XRE-family HTH domain